MSTMAMTATDTRRHAYDTFVDEVMDHLDVLHRVAQRLTRQTPRRDGPARGQRWSSALDMATARALLAAG